MVALNDLQIQSEADVKITFTLPKQYPEVLPEFFLPIRSSDFSEECKKDLLHHLNEEVNIIQCKFT